MEKQRVLTGITTTGTPHLGNYVGAIRPGVEASREDSLESFFFLADYHALIKCDDPEMVRQSSKEIAATWLALGLDTDNALFYRQSDVPQIPELTWILSCSAAKGLMNRAHAYKAAVQANQDAGDDKAAYAVELQKALAGALEEQRGEAQNIPRSERPGRRRRGGGQRGQAAQGQMAAG